MQFYLFIYLGTYATCVFTLINSDRSLPTCSCLLYTVSPEFSMVSVMFSDVMDIVRRGKRVT